MVEAELTARAGAWSRFISVTNEYNLLWREPERELLPALRAYGIGFIPYFPLQNGLLTGKYRREVAPADAKITNLKAHLLQERRGKLSSATPSLPASEGSPRRRWRLAGSSLNRPLPL